MQSSSVHPGWKQLFVWAGIVACLSGIWLTSHIGIARLFAVYGMTSRVLPAVNEAVQLTPSDPEVHYAQALSLQKFGRMAVALPSLEQARRLQPRNYARWLELGMAYDMAGQPEAAQSALAQAVKLAPHYAEPRWQLGNFLLRRGQRAAAFAEFRLAINRDPALTPNAVDLAWGAFNGDAHAIEQMLQPNTPQARLELARVFALRGAVAEAMRLFRTVTDHGEGTKTEHDRLFTELMKNKHFSEAREVWATRNDPTANTKGADAITNGGFEQDINFAEEGFGWRINESKPTVSVALDLRERYVDNASLRIQWEGKSYSSVLIAWQIVLVEPGKRYKLNFAARTKDLVSGGLPDITVLADPEGPLLASIILAEGSRDWKTYTTEFTVPSGHRSLALAIRRKACSSMPCPAFGTAWFDAFSLQ